MKSLVLALLVVSGTAHASYSRRHRSGPAPIRVQLTLGVEGMNYGDAMFVGHPKLDGRSIGPVGLVGRSFGARQLRLFDSAMHIEGITHHVVLGADFGFLYGALPGSSEPLVGSDPAHPGSFTHVQTGSWLTGFYVGPTLGTAWSWSAFDLAITTTIGYRQVGVPLLGFDAVPCGKNGSSRCPPQATNESFFAQPRLALGIHHGTWGIGGYVGGDVTPRASGWSTGVYLEVAEGLFRERATAPSGAAR